MKFADYTAKLARPKNAAERGARALDANNVTLLQAHLGAGELDLTGPKWRAVLAELKDLTPDRWREIVARGKHALSVLASLAPTTSSPAE